MDQIGKINRLNKIPHLLNMKREAQRENESKKKKEQNEEKEPEEDAYFSLESDEAKISKPPSTALVHVKSPKVEQRKSAKKGVGSYIDLTI